MTKSAIPYGRYSTLEQGSGSTLTRQFEVTTAWCESRGFPILFKEKDEGRSAYFGDNIHTGNLGKLARKVLTGEIDGRTTIIVVEELDRLSRQDALTILAWLTPLLVAGLSFGVANDDEIIDYETLRTDMGKFMGWLIKVFGNNKESVKKVNRLKAAWKDKRDKLNRGEKHVVNHRHPHWIEFVKGANGNEYRLHRLRVRLVREMFALHQIGHGKGAIAKLFNQRMLTNADYATWPMKTKQAKFWTPTYVGRVLNNLAVLGLWQPHSGARHEKRKPIGKPVMLYPPCITRETFDRVNDKRHVHQMKSQGKGRSLSNLLGVLARCAVCGGQMTPLGSSRTKINKDGTKAQHYFLYCANAKLAKSCTNSRGWNYSRVQEPLLDHLLTKAMDDQHFDTDDQQVHMHEGLVFRLRRRVEDATKGAQRLVKLIRLSDDDAILEAEYLDAANGLKALQVEFEAAQEQLAEARGAVTPSEHMRRVNEVRAMMDSDDADERWQARSRVKAALHEIVSEITFDPLKKKSISVNIVGGLGVILIDEAGKVTSFNLHKAGRDYSKSVAAPAIAAYLCRVEAISGSG